MIRRVVSSTFVVGLGEDECNAKGADEATKIENFLIKTAYFTINNHSADLNSKISTTSRLNPVRNPNPKNRTRFPPLSCIISLVKD